MSANTGRTSPAVLGKPGPVEVVGPSRRHRGGVMTWTLAVLVLALAASLAGLVLDDAYTGATATAAMLRGYDLVVLAMIVPALAVAATTAHNGSSPAQLLSASILAFLVYTYGYHVFGTAFNDLFLVHAALVATGVMALTAQLTAIDVDVFTDRARRGSRSRGAAAILGILAVALGGMWVYLAIENAVTGKIPAGSALVESDAVVHLGMALDLTLLVPLYAAAAVLLWRRTAWGYVLGTMALVAGALHQVSYMVALPFQVAADIPDDCVLRPRRTGRRAAVPDWRVAPSGWAQGRLTSAGTPLIHHPRPRYTTPASRRTVCPLPSGRRTSRPTTSSSSPRKRRCPLPVNMDFLRRTASMVAIPKSVNDLARR